MWFGDLVTNALVQRRVDEGSLRNFMAAKIVNPSFPAVNHDLKIPAAELPGRLRG